MNSLGKVIITDQVVTAINGILHTKEVEEPLV